MGVVLAGGPPAGATEDDAHGHAETLALGARSDSVRAELCRVEAPWAAARWSGRWWSGYPSASGATVAGARLRALAQRQLEATETGCSGEGLRHTRQGIRLPTDAAEYLAPESWVSRDGCDGTARRRGACTRLDG